MLKYVLLKYILVSCILVNCITMQILCQVIPNGWKNMQIRNVTFY